MDEMIKLSIKSREDAIYNAYSITDKSIQSEITSLFERMTQLGQQCKDTMEFETKLGQSPLNQEYMDLFIKISTTCTPKTLTDNTYVEEKTLEEEVAEEIESEIRYQVDSATQPLRREAQQKMFDKVRDIPGVGEAIQAEQTFSLFKKLRKKK